jgi:hypothetical protein
MARVPVTADFRLRRLLEHVGLPGGTPMPRQVVGIEAGPARSGHEPNWPARRPPPPMHQRSERPAPPRKT